MEREKKFENIRAALNGEAQIAIKNAKIVNVASREVVEGDVGVYNGMIIGVGKFSAPEEYDAKGLYLCPGFIDAHVHIESSMVIPATYARQVLPFGTTTVIADPHEITNVAGAAGVRAMYKLSDDIPLKVLFMLPSSVPATPFEHAGAEFDAWDMHQFLGKSRILGLGEMMDFVSVTGGSENMLEKIELFKGKPIDGHAPLLSGRALNAYCVAGPSTDHECSNYGEVLEKLRAGMKIIIRIGSAAKGVEDILRQIAKNNLPTDSMMLCTDDKHLADIRREGHINRIASVAVECGIDPLDAVRMASSNAARAYNIRRTGMIAPGCRADFALFEDLKSFKCVDVFTAGRLYRDEKPPMPLIPKDVFGSVNIKPLPKEPFRLSADKPFPVINLMEHQLVTKLTTELLPSRDGVFAPNADVAKLAVIERHNATGCYAVGAVRGFNIKNGALAATVAHDSHNMVIVGDNDRDMLTAMESLSDCGGGFAVVSGGVVLARLPLPIAGLMTAAPIEHVLGCQTALLDAAESIGIPRETDPLVSLSFLALPVIPDVRLTDVGVFDVINSKFLTDRRELI